MTGAETPPWRIAALESARAAIGYGAAAELPLSRAHELCSAGDIADALIEDLFEQRGQFPLQANTGHYLFQGVEAMRPRLRDMVLQRLKEGEFSGTGISPGRELTGKRTRFPAESWEIIVPDFENDIVRGPDGRIVASAVRVHRMIPERATSRNAPSVSQAALKRFIANLPPGVAQETAWQSARQNFEPANRVTRSMVQAVMRRDPARARGPGKPRKK